MTTSREYPYSNGTLYGVESDAARHAMAGYFLLVFTSSVIGDTTILIASIKYKAFKLHKLIISVIQHIALCDLLVTFTDVLPKIVSLFSNGWMFGNFLCDLAPYTKYYLAGTSILLICCMTTSKLLLLKHPLRFGVTSAGKGNVICAACWMTAATLPLSAFLVAVWNGQDIYFSYRTYYCDYGFSSDIWHWLKPLIAVVFMFIPNCVVVATTIYLLVIAERVARRGRESLKWQGIMTTVLTATVYCISVLPYAVYRVGESIVTDHSAKNFFHTSFFRVAAWFLYLNTMSNFYIYSLSVHSFRGFIWSGVQRAFRMLGPCAGSSAFRG